jgi:endonuclease YncB( thermonuclease family)
MSECAEMWGLACYVVPAPYAPLLYALLFSLLFGLKYYFNVYKVARHHDGDTIFLKAYPWQKLFRVRDKGKDEISIRLYGIDAPEKGQPYWDESLRALKKLCPVGSRILLKKRGKDPYRDMVGEIYYFAIIPRSISATLIESGWVYWDRKNAKKEDRFLKLERSAMKNKRGLWGISGLVRPDIYRRRKRDKRS